MATITLNIPDESINRIAVALCGTEGLEPTPANARTAAIRILRRTVRIYEEVLEQLRVEGDIPIT